MKRWLRSIPSHRHPGDLVRMSVGLIIFSALTLVAITGSVGPLEEYIFRAINALPSFLTIPIEIIMQGGALFIVPIIAALSLLQHHKRLPIKVLISGCSAWFIARVAKAFVDRDRPAGLLTDFIERNITATEFGFPSGHAAVAAALATVLSPYMPKHWRRLIWGLAWTVAIARVFVGVHLPLDVFAGLALGWMIGSAVNLLIGTPDEPLPLKAMREKLRIAGLGSLKLSKAHVDARGSTPIFAHSKNGDYFVKFVSHEHRNADIIYKAWRYFIMREVEDEAPFARALQLVEHEAYISDKARQAGVNTPKVVLAAPVTPKAAMFVSEKIDGIELSKYQGNITDKMLTDIWGEVKKLRDNHIAHRDLRASNVMIDKGRRPWLIDFSFAETAMNDKTMAADLVEMLVSLAHLVGAKRAVKSAVNVIGKEAIHEAVRYIQPLVLSSVTRKSIRHQPELLDDIRSEIQQKTQKIAPKKARISRFRVRTILWIALLAAIILLLIPEVGELDDLFDNVQDIIPSWVIAALGASFATYIMSAIVLLGASPVPLPYGKVFVLQLATSAVNRITPKGVGGIALSERFLIKNGFNHIEALSTVSLMYFAGVLVHILLTIGALYTLDQPVDLFDVDISTAQWWLIGFVCVFVLLGVAQLPKARYKFKKFIKTTLANARRGLEHPVSLLQLALGSAGVTLAYALAFYCSMRAIGVPVGFDVIFVVYLTGSAIASAAPTPSGLGATEAALAAGLTLFDVPLGQAVAGVLLFRFFTFWLPTIPGLLALNSMRKQQLI